jgi:hypothetical protein
LNINKSYNKEEGLAMEKFYNELQLNTPTIISSGDVFRLNVGKRGGYGEPCFTPAFINCDHMVKLRHFTEDTVRFFNPVKFGDREDQSEILKMLAVGEIYEVKASGGIIIRIGRLETVA